MVLRVAIERGTHLSHPKVQLLRGTEVAIQARDGEFFEMDGEVPGYGDLLVRLLPADIQVLV